MATFDLHSLIYQDPVDPRTLWAQALEPMVRTLFLWIEDSPGVLEAKEFVIEYLAHSGGGRIIEIS